MAKLSPSRRTRHSRCDTCTPSGRFIVLVREEHYPVPYLKEWLEEGIPGPAATLIYRVGPASLPDIAIYEWHSS